MQITIYQNIHSEFFYKKTSKINLKMRCQFRNSKCITGVVAWNAMGAGGVALSSEDGKKEFVNSGLDATGQARVAEVQFYILIN